MARKQYRNTDAQNQRWIREGRGSGHQQTYLPWLTVRDLPSAGRSHRVFGHKSQRTHHLLSDLELAVFLLLEWHPSTIEIREQFPLRLEDTQQIAIEAGVAHPAVNGVLQNMSSDFVVDTRDLDKPKFVLQAKYTDALQDPRTIEKLEIERRYWQLKAVPWLILTERDIPKVVFQNINWLYPAQRDELALEMMSERMAFYSYHFQQFYDKTVVEVAKCLDTAYKLSPGQSLLEIRQLLARRCFRFDILTSCLCLKAGSLQLEDIHVLPEALRVSNQ